MQPKQNSNPVKREEEGVTIPIVEGKSLPSNMGKEDTQFSSPVKLDLKAQTDGSEFNSGEDSDDDYEEQKGGEPQTKKSRKSKKTKTTSGPSN